MSKTNLLRRSHIALICDSDYVLYMSFTFLAKLLVFPNRDHSRKEKCKPRISNGEIKRDPEHRSRSSSNASYPRPQW